MPAKTTTPCTVVLASRNRGKITEINNILQTVLPGIQITGLDEYPDIGDIPETGETFEENALIKAETVSRKTGLTAIADDSGLVVYALNGQPGVFSARYAGKTASDQENNAKLLEAMADLEGHERKAAFVCVMAASSPEGKKLVVQGSWEGMIAFEPLGDRGFGYDPLFIDPELGLRSAQMDPELKNSRSHRRKALNKLAAGWKSFMAGVMDKSTA